MKKRYELKKLLSMFIALVLLAACIPASYEGTVDIVGTWQVKSTVTESNISGVPVGNERVHTLMVAQDKGDVTIVVDGVESFVGSREKDHVFTYVITEESGVTRRRSLSLQFFGQTNATGTLTRLGSDGTRFVSRLKGTKL